MPVGGIIRVPNVMTVTKNFPATTVAEFIAYGKANPGKINMASSGAGTSVHLSGELFKFMTGVDMKHVPYKGAGPATVDLIGGQVDVLFDNMPSIISHIRAGSVRALGVTSAQRSPALPDIPTVAEAGGPSLKGYEASSWFGLLAPAGTSPEIVNRIQQEVAKSLSTPAIKEKMLAQGAIPSGNSPADFTKLIASEHVKWAKVVKDSGAKVD